MTRYQVRVESQVIDIHYVWVDGDSKAEAEGKALEVWHHYQENGELPEGFPEKDARIGAGVGGEDTAEATELDGRGNLMLPKE